MLVVQSCRTLCNPVGCSPPGSSVHRILQARILEWVAIPFSRGSFRPTDITHISRNAGRFFTIWATREALKQLTQQHQAWPTDLEMSAALGSLHQAWRLRTQGQRVSLFASFPFPSSDVFGIRWQKPTLDLLCCTGFQERPLCFSLIQNPPWDHCYKNPEQQHEFIPCHSLQEDVNQGASQVAQW